MRPPQRSQRKTSMRKTRSRAPPKESGSAPSRRQEVSPWRTQPARVHPRPAARLVREMARPACARRHWARTHRGSEPSGGEAVGSASLACGGTLSGRGAAPCARRRSGARGGSTRLGKHGEAFERKGWPAAVAAEFLEAYTVVAWNCTHAWSEKPSTSADCRLQRGGSARLAGSERRLGSREHSDARPHLADACAIKDCNCYQSGGGGNRTRPTR